MKPDDTIREAREPSYNRLLMLAKKHPEELERRHFFMFPELGVYARDALVGEVAAKDDALLAEHNRLKEMEARAVNAEREAAAMKAELSTVGELQEVNRALREALRNAIGVIEGLADQQAMPDNWYVSHLDDLRALDLGVSPAQPAECRGCLRQGDVLIADLTCPVHGIDGTDPGDIIPAQPAEEQR